MERNLKVAPIRAFFSSLIFIVSIWYSFETQFATPEQLSFMYAVLHLLIVFLELPSGALADLMGRRKAVSLGLFINAFSFIIIGLSKNINWLWAGYLIGASGEALVSGAIDALNFDSLKELGRENTFSQFSSYMGVIFRSGMIIATLSGGYLYSIYKGLPYIAMGISTIIASLLTLLFTEPKIDSEKFSLKSYIQQIKTGAKELNKNEYMKDFSLYYILVGGITWYVIYFLGTAFATEIGFTVVERSWLFASIFFFSSIILYKLTHLGIMDRDRAYLMFPILMILGFLPGFWANKIIAVFCLSLVQFASMARFSILNQYSNLEIDSKYRATAISAMNMIVSIVFSVIAIIGGKIITIYGSGMIMTLLGVLSLVTVLPTAQVLIKKKLR